MSRFHSRTKPMPITVAGTARGDNARRSTHPRIDGPARSQAYAIGKQRATTKVAPAAANKTVLKMGAAVSTGIIARLDASTSYAMRTRGSARAAPLMVQAAVDAPVLARPKDNV